ncbi:hypothetical protein [Hyphomicrobium sp. ghe19]|uniref:hypothetical protein n=1 Tax=Hyphomicrobium sp. ghe19 TaxID=2682968 RepID=UPI0013672D69|nr:hypothetical protein HYPP_02525 [Hyphomicrobium sp. ghe19]
MKIKVSPQASKKIKSLPPEVLATVDSKLLLGESGLDVAKYLQNDCKQFVGEDIYNLKKSLERYRQGDLRVRAIERITTAQKTEKTSTIARRMNAMEELDTLAQQQRGRLDKMLMKESEMPAGILLKDATREIGMLKDLLVDLGRLQLETGILARAPKSFKGSIVDPAGTVTQFEWTEEQEKLHAELESLEYVSRSS